MELRLLLFLSLLCVPGVRWEKVRQEETAEIRAHMRALKSHKVLFIVTSRVGVGSYLDRLPASPCSPDMSAESTVSRFRPWGGLPLGVRGPPE